MEGIYNIVPTPFDEAGAIDEPSLRRLVDFIIDTDVDGLTILGFLGEAAKLSESERAQVIDVTLEVADGRVPVVVGATAPALDPCLRNARDAADRGAAGLLVAPPRTNRPNEASVRPALRGPRRARRASRSWSRTSPLQLGRVHDARLHRRAGRGPAQLSLSQAGGRPHGPEGHGHPEGQPGRGGLRRPGRQLHVRGAAAWRRWHDDRLRLSGDPRLDLPGLPGRPRGARHARPSTAICRSSATRTSRA